MKIKLINCFIEKSWVLLLSSYWKDCPAVVPWSTIVNAFGPKNVIRFVHWTLSMWANWWVLLNELEPLFRLQLPPIITKSESVMCPLVRSNFQWCVNIKIGLGSTTTTLYLLYYCPCLSAHQAHWTNLKRESMQIIIKWIPLYCTLTVNNLKIRYTCLQIVSFR